MRHLYRKIKSRFLELEKDFEKDEEILLRNAKYFFAFSILMITSVLIYYSRTGDEWLPLAALTITAAVFWTHSDKTGKIFMIAAASVGYIHEAIGGMEGWFVYTSGAFFQTPLWLIPGYAAMYWSCYNLWKRGRKKYRVRERNFKILAVAVIALMFILDATVCHFRPRSWPFDMAFIGIIILLFKVRAERHFAFLALALTTFNEFLGFSLGAWQHYLYPGQVSTLAGHVNIAAPAATGFSFTGLIPPYLLFLWLSIRFADFVNERRRMTVRETLLLAAALGMKAYTWLTTSAILVALQAGRFF